MNNKLKNKLVSCFMSILMVLSTILGYVPGGMVNVQAASTDLKEIKAGTKITDPLIDPDYDLKNDHIITYRNPSKCTMTNVDDDFSPYHPTSGNKYHMQKVKNIKNGKLPSVIWYKTGYDKKDKQYYNIKATVTGYKEADYTFYDRFTNKKIEPYIAFTDNRVGIAIRDLKYIDVSFEWQKYDEKDANESKPLTEEEKQNLRSYVTLADLDFSQAFGLQNNTGLEKIFKMKGTNHLSQNGNRIESKNVARTSKDEDAWVTAYMKGTNTWNVRFYEDLCYSEGHSGEKFPMDINSYGFPYGSYYGYEPVSLFKIPVPEKDDPELTPIPGEPNEPSISKRVGKKGTNWDDAEPAEEKEEAFEIDDYNPYDYLVQSAGPGAAVEYYKITDSLEDCLQIDDAAHVTIEDKNGTNVTGNFDVSVKGQTITCSAKPSYIATDDFKSPGQVFTVHYTVHRKKVDDIYNSMQAWIDPDDKFTFYVPNDARVEWHSEPNGTKQQESNQSWVTDKIQAVLAIEKDAKYDGWKVGDEIEYAVEVTQVKQDGYAVNVVVTDNDIPPSLKLINGSYHVDGPQQGGAASMSSLGENGWIVTCPLLLYGDSMKITFRCLATADSNGKDHINTAFATADNFLEDEEPTRIGDSAEVYVGTPVLTVDKVADRYEYEIGDIVKYTVNVNNTADYTIAENVVVEDIDIPEGLELQGEPVINMGSAQTIIGWPVPNGNASIATENRDNEVTAELVQKPFGNTWTVKAKYLPSGQPMQITFNCKATKSVNGIESQNVVSVTADNFLSLDQNQEPLTAQDDAEVYVNTAYFDIEKTVSDGNYEWQVGDHVPFDVTVTNVNDEDTLDLADDPKYADLSDEEKAKIGAAGKTVARNVIITDKDIPEGFILDFDSVDVQTMDIPQEYNEAQAIEDEVNRQLEEALAEDAVAGTTDESGMTEEEILREAGIDMSALDGMDNLDVPDESGDYSEPEAYSEDEDLYLPELDEVPSEEGTPELNLPELSRIEPASEELNIPELYGMEEPGLAPQDVHEPRPADPMTVEGIPDSFDDHIAGTPDKTNSVDEVIWNETEPTEITKTLEQIGNGWQLKISNLPAGNTVRVHFTCEATQPGNGAEGVNIGNVTADNGINKSDDAEAYINTAALSIDKEVVNKYVSSPVPVSITTGEEDKQDGREPYEFRVGEDVEYRLTVNNNQHGSIARNVVISDITIPEGLELDMGSITVEGLPEVFTNPIAGTDDPANQLDPDHYKETEILPVNYEIVETEGGFQVLIDNLPCTVGDKLNNWTTPVTITYHCTPTEEINGAEIINTAHAVADNAADVKDSERIWINSPDLNVIKSADRYEYMVGDTITYTVDVEQVQTGCVAREVTISDVIDTEGVKLDKSSIVLIDSDENVIEPEDVEINGNTFTVYTGRNLVKPFGYYHYDIDQMDEENEFAGVTQMGDYNPLGLTKETSMRLEYAVEIVDPDLAGQTVHNTVTVNSREDIPDETDTEVPVFGPSLDIEKVSDKSLYQVGEEAHYKLTIRELRDNVTAKQVVVTDTFQKDGMEISKINVRLNGEQIPVEIEQTENSFVIHTGIDMTDTDKLEVFYAVVFYDPFLHGQDILNIATAKGENTEEEMQDNCVRIVDETPGLEINKSSDKEFYKVGDVGHYKVVVSNTEKGTTARNIIIKDQLETEGAKIVKDSIIIRNDAGKVMDDAEIQYSDYRYAIYTGHDLEYKEEMTVTYDVLFESETLAGKDILNIARATCDNLRVETKDPDPILLPNGLLVHKSADPATGSVVKNGETINYSVNVVNTSNEDMRNVLVKDKIPAYTTYISSEEQDGVITGTRELEGKEYATFIIESLPAGEERTVSFEVMVTDAPEEEVIFNVAQVRVTRFDVEDMNDDTWNHESFRNTNETIHYTDTRWIKDENIVWIDAGKLGIEKVSDKTNYSVGEKGHYTVTVTQRVKDAIARNVVISDEIQKSGAYIQKDSIRAFILRDGAEEEEELTDIQVIAKDFKYTVYTNINLRYNEKIFLRYDVLFKEASLEGQQIKNVAYTKDDTTPEGEEPRDDNRVTVGDAGLIIEKTSDRYVYRVGDVGHYVLKVTCADPARTIENVVVKDVVKQQGAHLVTGTVRTYYDNEELKVLVDERDNGFMVATNHNLSGTHAIWVKYDVVFESESLNGKDVDNIATTWGDNTNPTDDTNKVHVGEGGSIITPPVTPPITPDPDGPNDRPTPTPTPSVPSDPVKGMTLTKVANQHEVNAGDVVSYTLTAKVNGKETAKNVVLSDTFDAKYFEYLEMDQNSFRSYIDNAEFTGELNVSSTGFTLKTGRDLAPGQVLKVTYNVLMKGDELKGHTVKNIAEVSADNMDTAKDKEAVYVTPDGPRGNGLTIEKSADKTQAAPGESILYTLLVKTSSQETAENVVIKDNFDKTGAVIDRNSIRVYLDNAEFEPFKLSADETGFTIQTGRDLAPGQVMKVTYTAVMDESLRGQNVNNTAIASSDNNDPTKDNETVIVKDKDPVKPGLDMEKSVDKPTVEPGEDFHYTLKVTTTSQETAKNVVIKDSFDKEGAYVDKSSIRLYLDDAQIAPAKLNVTESGFTMETGKDLAPGQIMRVTYTVTADKSLDKQSLKNVAVASSDNNDPSQDTETVIVEKPPVNPGLDIAKSADKKTAKPGEAILYTLEVRTSSKETAKNVVIKDSFDKTGAAVDRTSIRLYLNDAQVSPSKLSLSANGFTMETGKDLKAGDLMKVTYTVKADKSLEGSTLKNTAIASSDNNDPVKDTEIVTVPDEPQAPAGYLDLVKTADHNQVNLGETVKYTLTGRTSSKEDAKNVVVSDTLGTTKATIVKSSIKAYLNNAEFTPAKLNVTESGFTLETGKDLKSTDTLKVTYDVKMDDASLGGQTVKNTAVLTADNLDRAEDDKEVIINKPAPEKAPELAIDKSADVSETEVGGNIIYRVNVRQTVEGQTAKNVVVYDSFDTPGISVKGVTAKLNGKAVRVSVQKNASGLIIQTNQDLAYGSVLELSYMASVTDKALAGKTVGNTAVAKADNTSDVSAFAEVSVKGNEPEPTQQPQQDNPQNQQKPDNVNNSIGPKTGLVNHAGVYAGIGIGILAVAAAVWMVVRRRRNNK